jgi:hypothetical protein
MSMSRWLAILVVATGCYAKERDEALAKVASLERQLGTCTSDLTAARETPENRFARALKERDAQWSDHDGLMKVRKELGSMVEEFGSRSVGPQVTVALGALNNRIATLEEEQRQAKASAHKKCEERCQQPFKELPNCSGGWDVCRDQCILTRCMLHDAEHQGTPIP